MVELGMIVIVAWASMPEYANCEGLLYKTEYIEELKETTTVIKDVKCPNGDRFDYIVGINKKYLRPK